MQIRNLLRGQTQDIEQPLEEPQQRSFFPESLVRGFLHRIASRRKSGSAGRPNPVDVSGISTQGGTELVVTAPSLVLRFFDTGERAAAGVAPDADLVI